jgi:prepilin-type N-terminal cleavage/methylation domain-containing protein
MYRIRARNGAVSGFSAIELMVAMVILATVMMFAGALSVRLHRRYQTVSALREVATTVLASRMQAVRRNQNVVLFVDTANRHLYSWADRIPYNFVRDPGEPILNQYMLPSFLVFRATPSGPVDGPATVAFDTYAGNAALVDRIVFQGDGTLVPPQDTNSIPPIKPTPYNSQVPYGSVDCTGPGQCRGIYLADRPGGGVSRNVFRISIDDFGRSGKMTLLKWLPRPDGGNPGEWNFVPTPWTWVD